ncbi:hypothetical protein ACM25O_13325 [Sulfitobacter pontiacus]
MGQYFNIDAMQTGESVVLLVTAQTPYREKWAERTPVTVTRTATGWTYESTHGATDADPAVRPNPGHQGLNAHMQTLRGVPYPFETARASDLIAREYRLIRREQYARTSRTESATYPRSIYPERYGFRAVHALNLARETIAANKKSRAPYADGSRVWAGLGGTDGAPFEAYGESACRWIENPEARGLRFVGLAHDVGRAGYSYARDAVEHKGWYLDADGMGETVAGVVYQLPGRNGRARYLAGYADPHNTGADGRGPALLSLDVLEGDATDFSYDPDPVLRDAARRADGIAERMAEAERDYQAGFAMGRKARGKMDAARETGRAWLEACREARAMYAARHGFPALPGPIARELCRVAIATARQLRKQYEKQRRKASAWRAEQLPGGYDAARLDGFKQGYAEGELA